MGLIVAYGLSLGILAFILIDRFLIKRQRSSK